MRRYIPLEIANINYQYESGMAQFPRERPNYIRPKKNPIKRINKRLGDISESALILNNYHKSNKKVSEYM